MVTLPHRSVKATVILLHALSCDGSSFDSLAEELSRLGCKVVAPSAPVRRLHWHHGVTEVRSWYDYYTKRDGEDRHDVINVRHLGMVSDYILQVVDEHHTNGTPLILGGVSQGGTVVYHLLATMSNIPCLVAAMISRSTFLHTLVPNPVRRDVHLLVFSAGADEIYSPQLSETALNYLLENNDIKVTKKCKSGLHHGSQSKTEHDAFVDFVKKMIDLVKE